MFLVKLDFRNEEARKNALLAIGGVKLQKSHLFADGWFVTFPKDKQEAVEYVLNKAKAEDEYCEWTMI